MNFKALLLSSVVGITSIVGGVSEAQAARSCFIIGDGVGAICNSLEGYNKDGQAIYRVGFDDNNGATSTMDVICDGRQMITWRAWSRNMSNNTNNLIAEYFCQRVN